MPFTSELVDEMNVLVKFSLSLPISWASKFTVMQILVL